MKVAIFDLDGTLSDVTHRLHYIQGEKEDWDSFYLACKDDKPIKKVVELNNILYSAGYEIVILTGRGEIARKETIDWLWNNDVNFNTLIMRPKGDFTPDSILKQDMLDRLTPIIKQNVRFIFDDRDNVVKMWRDRGYQCFQVAPGDF